jgi:hypothetical protein
MGVTHNTMSFIFYFIQFYVIYMCENYILCSYEIAVDIAIFKWSPHLPQQFLQPLNNNIHLYFYVSLLVVSATAAQYP